MRPKGKIWRLGLMGYCSQKQFVLQLLGAMEKVLIDNGHRMSPGAGVGAAVASYVDTEVPNRRPRMKPFAGHVWPGNAIGWLRRGASSADSFGSPQSAWLYWPAR